MTQIIPRDLPIFFDEEKHKYTDALDREYISTTTIIGKFVEQKDWKAIAEACANIGSRPVPPTHRNYAKYIRYRGKTVKQILAEWKIETEKACAKGTEKHNFLEQCVKRCNNYYLNANGFINGRIYTIDDIDYSVFQVKDGDALTAEAILDRFENKLEIKGAVYRPGIYQFGGTLNTVRQLVEKAEGLMGDAFTGRAVLHRERENLKKEVIQVDIKGIMDGTAPDVPLQRNDVLYIPSIHDLEDVGSIMVYGEVARPGEFAFADNTTLEDIIIQAGGLMESASTVRLGGFPRIKDSKGTEAVSTIGQMYSFSLKDGFVIDGEPGFVLQPYDQVYVRKSPAYQEQVNVQVTGEVLYEGDYALTEKSERLSDLIKKAGGVTPFAYIKGARLSRRINADERKRMEMVLDMAKTGKDSIDVNRLDLGDIYYVGIDLEKAMLKPGSSADIVLREGDVIEIPEYNNTVRISGAVMYPNTVSFEDGKTLKYYIEQAGGYGFRAKKSKAYIVYMNGQVKRAKKGSRELIQPGCEVIVPVKEKSNWSLQNTLSIATTSASLATMIASIANILK